MVILPALALVAGVTVVVQRGRVLRAVAAAAVVVASGALTPLPPGEAAADSDRPGTS
ncbi:hypothetical protein [Iamia sp.]|uniref:hypothetical protein n=1 Tax=Iamia sp. TaxID=2722710 RepID=UPI002BF3BD90|nr:hypothetical protein [Iamia sp.]HXH57811.1 hypothetical protein [Iamia sp.]